MDRIMGRAGLIAALAAFAAAGLLFGLWPGIDLAAARLFLWLSGHEGGWQTAQPWIGHLRDVLLWIPALLVAPAVVTLALGPFLPRSRLMTYRAALFLVLSLALGPGLLVNLGLKEHWERPRPVDVREFGGNLDFVPWWDPRGGCDNNCSFVSGDVSGAFWTLAPAVLAPPAWRAAAYGAAIAFGIAMGALRMLAGGHFLSDVVFSGIFTFLVIWAVYALILRRRE